MTINLGLMRSFQQWEAAGMPPVSNVSEKTKSVTEKISRNVNTNANLHPEKTRQMRLILAELCVFVKMRQ